MKRAQFTQGEGNEVVHLRFVRDVAGFGENFLRGKLLRQFVTRGEQLLFAARTYDGVRAFAQEMPGNDLAEPLAGAGDERVDVFEFHIQARPTERCSTAGRFFNSFSRKRLASTKMRWRMAGTSFVQSA